MTKVAEQERARIFRSLTGRLRDLQTALDALKKDVAAIEDTPSPEGVDTEGGPGPVRVRCSVCDGRGRSALLRPDAEGLGESWPTPRDLGRDYRSIKCAACRGSGKMPVRNPRTPHQACTRAPAQWLTFGQHPSRGQSQIVTWRLHGASGCTTTRRMPTRTRAPILPACLWGFMGPGVAVMEIPPPRPRQPDAGRCSPDRAENCSTAATDRALTPMVSP